ncbi:3-oxoacyl-ACP synthase III family protein [Desulfobulbus alkaliphilus]|uniref:3-oxoacyl-ACP synthase III family protein n=1 Tax=Desulfobulbus alkaliphilus TaxID=869814 RepID=UPI001F060F78|nr:ketoacyl-ACP synthase III [Desulfobulbus alkaliphilus]
MPFFKCSNIKIGGIACAVPGEVVEVSSFIPVYGEDMVVKFTAMTGIKSFRRSHSKQTASDLGFSAAEHLLTHKGIDKSSIGALVFVAHSTDYRRPATACVLHKRLGLNKECAAYDINLGCSAYPYGLQAVASLMQCSDISRALLVVGETVTKISNPNDRSTAMLFGDAGAATLLEKTEGPHDIVGLLRTDGSGYRSIIVPAGGFRQLQAAHENTVVCMDGNERSLHDVHMNGPDVFNFTIQDVPRALRDFFQHTGSSVDDYDAVILHQANLFIIKQIARKLKIPLDKCPLTIDRFGNTSAGALPLTLCDAYAGKVERELRVLMAGFGVGLSWGVVAATINTSDLLPVLESDDYFAEGIITDSNEVYKSEA